MVHFITKSIKLKAGGQTLAEVKKSKWNLPRIFMIAYTICKRYDATKPYCKKRLRQQQIYKSQDKRSHVHGWYYSTWVNDGIGEILIVNKWGCLFLRNPHTHTHTHTRTYTHIYIYIYIYVYIYIYIYYACIIFTYC